METEWILTAFPWTSPIVQSPISTRYFIKHDQEYLLQWIQPPTLLLDFRVRARISSILRIRHRDRDRIYWVDSHLRKTQSCIESTSDSTLKWHTPPKLSALLLFFRRTCVIISRLNDVPSFLFHEYTDSVLIRESRISFKREFLALQLSSVHRSSFQWYLHINSSFRRAELKGYHLSVLMPTPTSPCNLLWVITKRASGIAVASLPIPQFPSSNNSRLMEYDLRDYPNASQCVLYWFSCGYRSNVQLCAADTYLQLSVHSYYVQTTNTKHLAPPTGGHSIRIRKITYSIQC